MCELGCEQDLNVCNHCMIAHQYNECPLCELQEKVSYLETIIEHIAHKADINIDYV